MRKISYGVMAAFLLAPLASSAHHGAGLFEAEKTLTVVGTVTQFQFVNPHVLVYMTVANEDGTETEWAGELTSPNRLARSGTANVPWHKDILERGDEITMTGRPARNGAPAMAITKLVANGVTLIGGN